MNRIEGPDWGVPHEVETTIRKQADGFAARAGRPDAAEDLAQEARIEAWKTATVEGDTNIKHILADSKERVRDAARLGSSVDGKIYPTWKRRKIYGVISLDVPVGDGTSTVGEIWTSDGQTVEEMALGKIMVEEAIGQLTFDERRVLKGVILGFNHKEIARRFGFNSHYQVKRRLAKIKAKAARYFEREDLL